MENTTPVRITGEGARYLADLHSVLRDLQWVQVACVLTIKQMADKPNAFVVESLQTSALIRYCRTFEGASQTRFSLGPDVLEALPAELQQAHHEFCALRQLYVAHSTDDLLWNIPTAHIERNGATGSSQVCRLSVEDGGLVTASRESMVKLYELVRRLLCIVQARFEQETSRALEVMRTRTAPRRETGQPQIADPIPQRVTD